MFGFNIVINPLLMYLIKFSSVPNMLKGQLLIIIIANTDERAGCVCVWFGAGKSL